MDGEGQGMREIRRKREREGKKWEREREREGKETEKWKEREREIQSTYISHHKLSP